MIRNLRYFFLIFLLAFLSCKKEEIDTSQKIKSINSNVKGSVTVSDDLTLSKGIIIVGASQIGGDVPIPDTITGPTLHTNSQPGFLDTIIITQISRFNFQVHVHDSLYLHKVFIRIDSINEYFEIDYDSSGTIVGKNKANRLYNFTIGLDSNAVLGNNFNAIATIWGYIDTGTADSSNADAWTQPVQVLIKAMNTGTGDVTITLTWNTFKSDFDLILIEPSGAKIYYDNLTSTDGGKMDFLNFNGYGPESIYYTVTPPTGTYQVWVRYTFDIGGGATDWNLSIKNGELITRYSGLNFVENDSIKATTFTR